jgi:hypothetical protein
MAEAKKLKKEKELQTLTENLISKYQGKAYRSQFRKKNRSAYASAVFYEKFWVTGNDNSIKWNISFCRAGRNYKFSSDKLSLTETKLRYPHRRTAIVLSTI